VNSWLVRFGGSSWQPNYGGPQSPQRLTGTVWRLGHWTSFRHSKSYLFIRKRALRIGDRRKYIGQHCAIVSKCFEPKIFADLTGQNHKGLMINLLLGVNESASDKK
jgi:hypothetical protein